MVTVVLNRDEQVLFQQQQNMHISRFYERPVERQNGHGISATFAAQVDHQVTTPSSSYRCDASGAWIW